MLLFPGESLRALTKDTEVDDYIAPHDAWRASDFTINITGASGKGDDSKLIFAVCLSRRLAGFSSATLDRYSWYIVIVGTDVGVFNSL
jgi:hypothetical protein